MLDFIWACNGHGGPYELRCMESKSIMVICDCINQS